MSKRNIKFPFVRLIDWVWRNPKANVSAGIKKACDDMPPRQRLMVVTVLLSVFVLLAFFAFGHACYKIGAKQVLNQIEVEHIYNMELPKSGIPEKMDSDEEECLRWLKEYKELGSDEQLTDSVYDITGMESED
ncbi:MAG: TraL conjugative transposon family protein [Muribaculum sp.]|nr:TraL conjugative transposon family protein [Muribaculum sp.]